MCRIKEESVNRRILYGKRHSQTDGKQLSQGTAKSQSQHHGNSEGIFLVDDFSTVRNSDLVQNNADSSFVNADETNLNDSLTILLNPASDNLRSDNFVVSDDKTNKSIRCEEMPPSSNCAKSSVIIPDLPTFTTNSQNNIRWAASQRNAKMVCNFTSNVSIESVVKNLDVACLDLIPSERQVTTSGDSNDQLLMKKPKLINHCDDYVSIETQNNLSHCEIANCNAATTFHADSSAEENCNLNENKSDWLDNIDIDWDKGAVCLNGDANKVHSNTSAHNISCEIKSSVGNKAACVDREQPKNFKLNLSNIKSKLSKFALTPADQNSASEQIDISCTSINKSISSTKQCSVTPKNNKILQFLQSLEKDSGFITDDSETMKSK